MIKTLLRKTLTQRQKDTGLHLYEPDDHTIELWGEGGKRLAVFSSSGATVIEIRREADKHI